MNHLSEEQLIWFYYGELREREAAGQHLAECDACHAAFAALEQRLAQITEALPAPERDAQYGAEVWARLQPSLAEPAPRAWFWSVWSRPQRWAAAAAMASLLMGAFLAGRFWPRQQPEIAAQTSSPQVRERILLVAVGDHLERSQMVLLEVLNSRPGEVDMSDEQRRAEDLVASNRLYRQAAARSGDAGVAAVLDELERALLDIAHSPAPLSSAEFEGLRQRLEAQGILFKIRVIDSRVREKAIGRSL